MSKKKRIDPIAWAKRHLKSGIPIVSKPSDEKYRENYDKIDWGKDKNEKSKEDKENIKTN